MITPVSTLAALTDVSSPREITPSLLGSRS